MAKTPIEIKSLARAHTESALNTLAGIMNEPSAPHAARVSAANSLLDRGWGKAPQTIAGDPDNPLKIDVDMTDEKRVRALAALIARTKHLVEK